MSFFAVPGLNGSAATAAPSTTGTNATLSEEEVLAMSERDAIVVEGKALHKYDAVLQAAKNGLIGSV